MYYKQLNNTFNKLHLLATASVLLRLHTSAGTCTILYRNIVAETFAYINDARYKYDQIKLTWSLLIQLLNLIITKFLTNT